MIPLTVPEVRRLLRLLTEPPERHGFLLRWSRWRRAHQAVARRGGSCPSSGTTRREPPGPANLSVGAGR